MTVKHIVYTSSINTPRAGYKRLASLVRLLLPLAIQLNAVITEFEIYSYVRKSYRMFEQAVYQRAYGQPAIAEGEHSHGAEHDDGGEGVESRLDTAFVEVLDAMLAQSDSCVFDRLEDAMDR